jgi:SAM-dependent MidA family methyltransferase
MERLDRFMARAAAAYYARPGAIGGDFTTAPEISQAFGEVLGAWCAVAWERMGRPDPVILCECGPGRGTLMADALRAIAPVAPGFRAALRLHLVETSPALRAAQARALGEAVAGWHDGIGSLPEGPLLLLANEFLDALPIRQFIRRGDAWMERHVAEGGFVEASIGAHWPASPPPQPSPARGEGAGRTPSPVTPQACLRHDAGEGWGGGPIARNRRDLSDRQAAPFLPETAPEGAVFELNEPARAFAAELAARLAHQGGAALLVDYGHAGGFGDTLQAMAGNATGLDPLAEPGSRDLTAHVDFAALAEAARAAGAEAFGPIPQGLLLGRLGLASRAAMLAAARPRLARDILSGAERLAAPERMGRLFKALALCDASLGVPPGFEEP